MTDKLKTIRLNGTMRTHLYQDVNVPESTTHEQILDFILDGNIDGGDMLEHESWGIGGWTWQETDMDREFDPEADDMSKSLKATLASLPEEDEFE